MIRWQEALLVVGILAAGGSTQASPLFTFGFNDLNGTYSFNGVTGLLTVEPTSLSAGGPFDSSGDVTRVFAPEETADYDTGFTTLGTAADVSLTMQVSNVTADSADAAGSFLIVDANGDRISGEISGVWSKLGNFANFEGLAQNVLIGALSGDGTFDGPSGGSFGLDLPGGPTYHGALLALESGAWFDGSFDGRDIQITAAFLPEPATLIVMFLGATVLLRRGSRQRDR